MSLIFTSDGDDAPDVPAIAEKRGRRPGRPDDVVTPLRADHRTVVVLDPWRVVGDDGKVHWPGDTATVPDTLAAEWLANHWVK
jgi:hypothetical protein